MANILPNHLAQFHVISRGNNKATVFHEAKDFTLYLNLLREIKDKANFALYNYSLMNNHPHLLAGFSDKKHLGQSAKWLNENYARKYRLKYGGVGHVWRNRPRRFLIEDDSRMLTCAVYIELNPVRAGIVTNPNEYQWSSHRYYSRGETNDLIDDNPTYLSLGDTPEERQKRYNDTTVMWATSRYSKKEAAKYFGGESIPF